ncbi:alpha/beta hydrolase fold protein [Labilithrix luteola]|uniref:Alpha/beta hydrolase fold protein n=1 Tax=Labilithrix luteola TaxID=1391654 RepID=A0A0K1PP90_9BACT|nr:alpha/beta hydrolase [Labilithrix luteola]AKU94939.1 alpha/beta hydrolase fold protein [Labilithrix luteola]
MKTIAIFAGVVLAALVAGCAHHSEASPAPRAQAPTRASYENVNGLSMYYEVHGSGAPLVLLHGGVSTIENSFGAVIPILARHHTVIAIEQQAHGHTPDIDRPLSYDQMAEDTNRFLTTIGIPKADFLGWSDGGAVALRVAMRHPDRVRRLVLLSSAYDNDGLDPASGSMEDLTAEMIPPVFRDAYTKAAPDPGHWPVLVEKIKAMSLQFKGWSKDEVRAVQAPTLVMLGDRDIIRTEYAAQMAHLLPHAQLAILPGCDHFAIYTHPDWVVGMATTFLESRQ